MKHIVLLFMSSCFAITLNGQVTKILQVSKDASGNSKVDTIKTNRPDTIFNKPSEQLLNRAKAQSNSYEIPIFKSKKDSVDYSAIQLKINAALQNKVRNNNLLDSLFKSLMRVSEKGIIGFRRNYISNPEYTSFNNLKDINPNDVIKLSISEVSSLPDLSAYKNLETLELVNTSISKIPKKLNRLTKLKTVYVYNNKTKTPLKLKRNKHVTTLVVQGDQPSALPKSFKSYTSLSRLDLSRNSLELFPNGARKNKRLTELILTNNAITLANNEIKLHPYLKKLDLYKNKIEKVPGSIGNLPSLKTLKFNYNLISEVSADIAKLKQLEELSFYNNRLTAIPEGVYQLTSLKEIDLYYNQIDRLDENAIHWSNLEVLYLAYNKVYSLPNNLGELNNLEELYLHDNRLNSLPENLSDLKKLKVLRINNNNLLYVPASFSKLTNLENLDISRNEIHSLPEDFFNFQHLKILALVANPWDAETKEILPEKTKELRAREVVVHLNSFDETIDN